MNEIDALYQTIFLQFIKQAIRIADKYPQYSDAQLVEVFIDVMNKINLIEAKAMLALLSVQIGRNSELIPIPNDTRDLHNG